VSSGRQRPGRLVGDLGAKLGPLGTICLPPMQTGPNVNLSMRLASFHEARRGDNRAPVWLVGGQIQLHEAHANWASSPAPKVAPLASCWCSKFRSKLDRSWKHFVRASNWRATCEQLAPLLSHGRQYYTFPVELRASGVNASHRSGLSVAAKGQEVAEQLWRKIWQLWCQILHGFGPRIWPNVAKFWTLSGQFPPNFDHISNSKRHISAALALWPAGSPFRALRKAKQAAGAPI